MAIREHRHQFRVVMMCRVAKVSTSGFYAWLAGREPSKREKNNEALKVHIRVAFQRSRKTYGSPRIRRDLVEDGHRISRKRVARLMKSMGLQGRAPKRFKHTTDSKHDKRIAENLLQRNFDVAAPNQVWVGDITYIRTWEGWVYLAVLIDLFSRRVVGFALDDEMPAQLCIEALQMARRARAPGPGLMAHSDRGSQYASDAYRNELREMDAVQSMSRKGDCWDNAVAESFFSTLKTEMVHRRSWVTKADAEQAVYEWIEEFYNPQRRHSANGLVSPVEHELRFISRVELAA
jgi:putative transposase